MPGDIQLSEKARERADESKMLTEKARPPVSMGE